MKFSENWLREYVNPEVNSETLMHQLTMAGLEVDGHEPACPSFTGLVVAEVKSVSKHLDADKLHICEVDCGEQELVSVVCGAENVRVGLKTVLAKVGANLPSQEKVEIATLKGIRSYGMLCSAAEIGLGECNTGIMELPDSENNGKALTEIIDTEDNIIDISLTPNRGDCLSITGIAREVAVFNDIEWSKMTFEAINIESSACRTVQLSAKSDCPHYVSRVIENVDCSIKTPLWLTERLRRSGIRSINAVVDITNYVMLELGQPMHAFDNDRLHGDINVRYPNGTEKITLLDDSEHELGADTLLITDDSGPIAIAGIMGGYNSALTTQSSTVFLESAFFVPKVIIGKSRQYGLHTDSSHRFERGVEPELQEQAITRASQLILQLCGGQAGPVTIATSKKDIPRNKPITLRRNQVKRVLGVDLDDAFITNTFSKLGMTVSVEEDQWLIIPPSHRFDINIEVDLIEELARIYSYDAIDTAILSGRLSMLAVNPQQYYIKQIREILLNNDYQEAITYSFVDPELDKLLSNTEQALILANPIAPELSQMRGNLITGLLSVLKYNVQRQQDRVRLFETGLVFEGCEQLSQNFHIAGLCYGDVYDKQWGTANKPTDFFDLKNDVMTLLTTTVESERLGFTDSTLSLLHPGQAVTVLIDGYEAGFYGQLHPKITTKLGLKEAIYVFDFEAKYLNRKMTVKCQPISKFPAIKRDIAIVIDENIALSEIMVNVKENATKALFKLELFDVYQGDSIDKAKKSLALGLTFQVTSSTLTDKEVDTIMEEVREGLSNEFGATLR